MDDPLLCTPQNSSNWIAYLEPFLRVTEHHVLICLQGVVHQRMVPVDKFIHGTQHSSVLCHGGEQHREAFAIARRVHTVNARGYPPVCYHLIEMTVVSGSECTRITEKQRAEKEGDRRLIHTVSGSPAMMVIVSASGGMVIQLPSLACTSRPSTSCYTIAFVKLGLVCLGRVTSIFDSSGTP
jgi:hypothetical protein